MTIKVDLRPALIDELDLYAGDDEAFMVSFVDESSAAIDVSHLTWTSQIRSSRNSETAFDVDINTDDAVNGNIVIEISATITRTLPRSGVWDLQYVSEDEKSVTILQADVTCSQDVTRAS